MLNKVILLCYLYDLDRLKEIASLVRTCNIQTYITTDISHKNNQTLIENLIPKHLLYRLEYIDNYGADISPFLNQLKQIDSERFPFFVKIHSKNSKWGFKKHVEWGSVLIDALIGNREMLIKNLKILSRSDIGMLCHSFFTFDHDEGHNHSKILEICKIIGIDYTSLSLLKYAAGTMFMGKTQTYNNILNKDSLLNNLLEQEKGKLDDLYHGTYAHSMERVLGYLNENANLKITPLAIKSLVVHHKKFKKLHLHITYNNYCYIVENIHNFGKILFMNNEYLEIQWFHFDNKPIVKYVFLTPSSIIFQKK